jgi:hypothetical protein
MKLLSNGVFYGSAFLVLVALLPSAAGAGAVIGPRVGYDFNSENLVLGAEAELGRVFQGFHLASSLDFELGDNTLTTLNADFRLYLFHLPETGLHFYGSAGPTVLFASGGEGDSQTEIGLSLVAGVKIPMKDQNRYHLEARFGIGDIPEFKLMFAVLFCI